MAVQGKYLYWNSDLSDVNHIRNEVLYKELGIQKQKDEDITDKLSIIAIVYSNNDETKAVGTGRIIYDGNNYTIDQVLVLKEERNNYYGDFIIRLLTTKGFLSGANEISLITTLESVSFFEKIGFTNTGNDFQKLPNGFTKMKIKQENICKKCNK